MIILPWLDTLIITPPKTASRALIDGLCRGGPGILCVGMAMAGRGVDHHNVEIPFTYARYRILAIVRHPLDRLVSLYHHRAADDAYWGRESPSFATTLQRTVQGEEPDAFYRWTLCQHLEGVADFTPVRFENLVQDLAAVGVSLPELPRVGAHHRRPWPEYFTPELTATAQAWAAPDADRFGYELPRA